MLTLHRAERASTLVDALAEVLGTPLADPFAAEVVAVPAKGVERWLAQRLAATLGAAGGAGAGAAGDGPGPYADGVCANVVFPSPGRLVADAVTAAVATAGSADVEADPWARGRLHWEVLRVLDDCLGAPWCAVLAAHLGSGREDHRRGRRFATAAHLSELYASYALHRPQLLLDWAAGRWSDGAGGDLPADLHWQAHLWRELRQRVGVPGPAERLGRACRRLREEPALLDLPERLSVFGPTRLSTADLAVLEALAAGRDVHLWLPHPSPVMWDALRDAAAGAGTGRRGQDLSAGLVTHPLLVTLARDVREMQRRLPAVRPAAPGTTPVLDRHHRGDEVLHPTLRPTLLASLQADIRADRAPTTGVVADGTLSVHACHGAPRQVEVLREVLLRLLQQDPSLEPRDVLVMCPDVEAFAPLVRAAFGQRHVPPRPGGHDPSLAAHPGHQLRVRLADRSLRRTNPLLDVVARLLALADGRVTGTEVLDLAASAPVRRRFGLADQDLERVRDWAAEAGVRWGIGLRQREAYGLPTVLHNTWTSGLDRILLGVTADEDALSWLGRALPLDDVDSNDIDLAGRLAELVDRLAGTIGALQGERPAEAWTAGLCRALDLLTEVATVDAWQHSEARRALVDATVHAGAVDLRLADVRAMLADVLAGRPTRANFRTGELTVCTMVPMRSVPHRVVVLLGLDDEVFPRGAGVDGDDVLGRDPCLGERDPRSEDRQLLLDAVMAAQERLVVLYTGADPVTGAPRPPAAPLGELLDVVALSVGEAGMPEVHTRHPLQPFDPGCFDPADPWSFDRAALAGARAAQSSPRPEPPLLPGPLPATVGDVDLGDLVAFLEHPTQAFLRQRLGLRVPAEEDEVSDALRAELDGLAKWAVGDRLLTARLAGAQAWDLRQAELRRGSLPPLRLGDRLLEEVGGGVDALTAVALPLYADPARTVDVAVELGDGRRVSGTVTGVHGDVLTSTTYSQLRPKHRLAAWARLLALAAAQPGAWTAVTTGRGPWRRPAWRSTLRAPEDALDVLRQLVDLRDRGLRAPLPVATVAGATYAERRAGGSTVADALQAAEKEFSGRYGEVGDRHLGYVHGGAPLFTHGGAPPFARLTAEEPAGDERGWAGEPTRFGVLARRLWDPLLAAESLGLP